MKYKVGDKVRIISKQPEGIYVTDGMKLVLILLTNTPTKQNQSLKSGLQSIQRKRTERSSLRYLAKL